MARFSEDQVIMSRAKVEGLENRIDELEEMIQKRYRSYTIRYDMYGGANLHILEEDELNEQIEVYKKSNDKQVQNSRDYADKWKANYEEKAEKFKDLLSDIAEFNSAPWYKRMFRKL